ncbi:hypothetical protein RMN56_07200 [Micromonospora halotolerans]|uniref:Uncharacterized protein n=1 Tax=Micromonospora halotolerans TaxID=709879 RepID=A0ABZ0A2P9_9ACTN|nr:hypothetical protein [Micromonospora halotolerans]WNM41130.1 hypothetical protein RMN56_07200 [Micromonospora halotolerans]
MIDVELLMDELGRRQIDVLIRVDRERMAQFNGRPWTMPLSGPGLGGRQVIRVDTRTLPDALDHCLAELAACPGDWAWLDAYRGLPRS